MGQEDRFKKEIDQFANAMAKLLSSLLGIKQQGKSDENFAFAKKELKDKLELDAEFLCKADSDSFLKLLSEKKYNNQHLGFLGDILFEMAEIAVNIEESRELYLKSFAIYNYLTKVDSTYSFDRHFKVQKINRVLGQ